MLSPYLRLKPIQLNFDDHAFSETKNLYCTWNLSLDKFHALNKQYYSGNLKFVTESRNESAMFANSDTERAVSNVAVVVCEVIS